jgi:hypothetical protein
VLTLAQVVQAAIQAAMREHQQFVLIVILVIIIIPQIQAIQALDFQPVAMLVILQIQIGNLQALVFTMTFMF